MATLTLEQLDKRVTQIEHTLNRLELGSASPTARIGAPIGEVKPRLREYMPRTEDAVRRAKAIVGIWNSGAGDLSEHLRDYLYGERR